MDAIARELSEEAGVNARSLKLISVYEFFNPEGMLADGIPEVKEPGNKTNWGWHEPSSALELPLFEPDKALIEHAVSGVIYDTP
jgi:ADP-ribose pyrophosphatase YjhB (NUDIX family)